MREPLSKTVLYRQSAFRGLFFLFLAMLVGLAGIGLETVNVSGAKTDSEEIHINADKIIADLDNREAELLGNVRVTQQKTTITADKMKVFYQESKSQQTDESIQGAISKIVANGNVNIKMENMVAEAEEAIYIRDSDMLTLSGADSRLSSGPNSITGSKIIFFRTTRKLIVEGSPDKQVKALIYTKKTDLF